MKEEKEECHPFSFKCSISHIFVTQVPLLLSCKAVILTSESPGVLASCLNKFLSEAWESHCLSGPIMISHVSIQYKVFISFLQPQYRGQCQIKA